ncbi:Calmodulin-binding protein 60 D [Capsicum chinense]|nr:Calmodulin-binding protein 60 D [Capsicum chinense]
MGTMTNKVEMPSWVKSIMTRLDAIDRRIMDKMEGRLEGTGVSLCKKLDTLIEHLSLPNQIPVSGYAPHELQGNQTNFCTLVNEDNSQLSVNDSLSLSEPNVPSFCDDNVQREIVDTLVDSPSVESIVESGSTLSYGSHEDQLVCENDNVEHVGRMTKDGPRVVFVIDHDSIEGIFDHYCNSIGVRKCITNPCPWTLYPFDFGDHLKCGDDDVFWNYLNVHGMYGFSLLAFKSNCCSKKSLCFPLDKRRLFLVSCHTYVDKLIDSPLAFSGLRVSPQELALRLETLIRSWEREEIERPLQSALSSVLALIKWLLIHAHVYILCNTSRNYSPSISMNVLVDIVGLVVLDGEFNPDDHEDWTEEEFSKKVIREREGKRPLLTGDLIIQLRDGVGYLGNVSFTDNSSWTKSRTFRLGLKLINRSGEFRVREGVSKPLIVRDHRGENNSEWYIYDAGESIVLLFNCIYELVGATLDGQNFQSLDKLDVFQKRMVENFKRGVYKKLNCLVLLKDHSLISQAVLTSNLQIGLSHSPSSSQQTMKYSDEQEQLDSPTAVSMPEDFHGMQALSSN